MLENIIKNGVNGLVNTKTLNKPFSYKNYGV